ncbi:MAG: hypothetical protein LBK58_14345 [Prevotellaceae bacterium]|jgi:hypothetical protein|nr:hypothetical protein [Prevotellaceae bacterium]
MQNKQDGTVDFMFPAIAGNILLYMDKTAFPAGNILLYVNKTAFPAGNILLYVNKTAFPAGNMLLYVNKTAFPAGNMLSAIAGKANNRLFIPDILHVIT